MQNDEGLCDRPGWNIYDNDKCLVARILPDGIRKRARLFSGFLSHYLIRDRYGRPGKGNDKGSVECTASRF